jgi:hypothetical protein
VRRPILALVIFVVAFMNVPAPANATAGGCGAFCVDSGSVDTYDSGLIAQAGYSSDQSHGPVSRPGPTDSGPLVEYDYHPVCDGNCHSALAQGVQDAAGCQGAEVATWVASRTVNPPGQWILQGPPECLTAAEQLPFDPGQLQATVDNYFQRIPLPAPKLRVAPADNAVVNLPEIVSADAPVQTTFTVDVAPFPTVTINAKVSWEWDFGDGESLTTTDPGRPYDPSDPDPSHYLTHAYQQASTGWQLSVTSVWTATYTVEGLPGTTPVTGAVRRTTTRSLPAADYGSTLTGN